MKFRHYIAFFILLLASQNCFSQNSVIARWRFAKISDSDSITLSVTEKKKLREFIIQYKKINFNTIPPSLTDTINRYIEQQVSSICSSFLQFNGDSTFEASKNELFIPIAIPGLAVNSTLFGTWKYNNAKQIITFKTEDDFKFQYKVVSIDHDKLLVGIVYAENQSPKFIITFAR